MAAAAAGRGGAPCSAAASTRGRCEGKAVGAHCVEEVASLLGAGDVLWNPPAGSSSGAAARLKMRVKSSRVQP
jgi:hypothetical protein